MKLYKKCNLTHIPNRLHAKGRKASGRFYMNEKIYRRCSSQCIDAPFADITLSDISLNRRGKPDKTPVSIPPDVLLNCKSDHPKSLNEAIVTLRIKRLNMGHTFHRKLRDGNNVLEMTLLHDPFPCNYSHTVFELKLNGTVVTYANYKSTLAKNTYKHLRTACRLEISKMIIRKAIL